MTTTGLRVADAQTLVTPDVPTRDVVAAARDRVLDQLEHAADGGARLVCFPEGTLAYPGKRVMSRRAPDLDEADWTRADWPAITGALDAIRRRAADRGIWTVVGGPHRLSDGRRPHNSLYVFDDAGNLVTRYDKRFLSTNEAAYLYTPGTEDVIVAVDGVRIAFLLCLETLFPERFAAYADAGVDLVLIASAPDPKFGMLAHASAIVTGVHVGLAMGASGDPDDGRSGICSVTPTASSARLAPASCTTASTPQTTRAANPVPRSEPGR